MKRRLNILSVIVITLFFCACDEYLEPNPYDNTYDEEYVWNTPTIAEGVLLEVFNDVHPNSWRVQNNEVMAVITDDAVSSNLSSIPGNFAQGLQSPFNNLSHLSTWNESYQNLFNINKFLENLGSVPYDPDSTI